MPDDRQLNQSLNRTNPSPLSQRDWILGRAGPDEMAILFDDERMSIAGTANSPCTMAIRSALGIWVEDETGRRYRDLYGNNSHHIGYRHPHLVQALREQLDTVPWVSRGFTSAVNAAFAKKLATLVGRPDAKVLTERNGADAVETALALARASTGRYKTISFYGAYHGRSAGALSVSGSYQHRQGLGPLLPGAIHVPPFHRHAGSAPGTTHESCARESLTAIRTVFEYERDIGAVIGETIRNFAYVPPDWYWTEVRKLCDHYGALLILDEIATGLGKTGSLFNFQRFDLRPDMVCIAKSIGGAAMPLSAVVVDASLDIDPALNVGYYTNEKNPLGARAGLATLEIIEAESLVENARTLGAHAAVRLDEMRRRHDVITAVRAAGLMFAVEFEPERGGKELADVVYRGCVDRGVIPMFSPAQTVGFSVPLVIDQRNLDECIDIIDEVISAASMK